MSSIVPDLEHSLNDLHGGDKYNTLYTREAGFPGEDSVMFNGVPGVVIATSDTQLVVKVAYGVMTGHLSVGSGGLSTSGPDFSTVSIGTVPGMPGSPGLTNGDDWLPSL